MKGYSVAEFINEIKEIPRNAFLLWFFLDYILDL